jgi:hypothetical protein
MKEMRVRLALIQWFGTYLNKRSHFTKVGNDTSDYAYINGGVPQGSKLGPIAFVSNVYNNANVVNNLKNDSSYEFIGEVIIKINVV